ncbi:radical SAM family heme chaperone HemW [soil metagenome]
MMHKAGVYIHIPFCKSRCSYCDFATDVFKNEETVERYVNALVTEISNFKFQILPKTKNQKPKTKNQIDTIYFGGGTPSLLQPRQLEKILDVVHEKFSVDKDSEITMEMNPATVTIETLKDYKLLGINRASFGAQTFDDTELKRLGRRHTAQDVRETIELLRNANYENVSFDLIAGLPRQTLPDWERNLTEALKLDPEHISLYLLEIHEGTPLAEQIRSERQPLPDEDLAGEMYLMMLEKLAAKNYEQYEISNFSRIGFESKHNLKYWTFAPYFSFGVSAHSFDGNNLRWANERDTFQYVKKIESDNSPIVEKTELDETTRRAEYAFLRLRLNEGIDLIDYKNKFGIDLVKEYSEDLARLQEADLIEISENNLRLSKKGRLYSNEVFSVFV